MVPLFDSYRRSGHLSHILQVIGLLPDEGELGLTIVIEDGQPVA